MNNTRLPERPHSHQLDDAACREVERILRPHIVETRGRHDYGKDLRVMLVEHSTPVHKVTGREFSVQVKGTDGGSSESIAIKVRSLNSWLNSIEPVLLLRVAHPETSGAQCRATWIDDELLLQLTRSVPEWKSHETVTVPLGFEVSQASLPDIERRVNQWRPRRRTVSWDPGEFAVVETEASGLARELTSISTDTGLEGPVAALRTGAKRLERLAYSVAILGNSRAGKSTLLNRLLGRDISPVSELPTTAVVMSVTCGEDETATVCFLDGTEKVGAPTSRFLAPYMTQERNPNNERGVAHVLVRISDRILSTGITLLDLPGFHDADPEIRAISEAALERVDACVYLIDLAPYATASFFISEQHVADIRDLVQKCDRVLLGLSKADCLKKEKRSEALEYVLKQLRKYDLADKLASPPLLVGVSPKKEKGKERLKSPKWLSSDELKDEIWRVLLQDGEIATARVHESLAGIIAAQQDLVRATKARLLAGKRAAEVRSKLATVEGEVEQIRLMVEARCQEATTQAAQRVRHSTQRIVADAEAWVRGVPANLPLPEAKDVRARLYRDAQHLFFTEGQRVNADLSSVMIEAEKRIHTVLEQLPIGKLERSPAISAPEVPEIAPFPLSAFEDGIWGSILVTVGAWAFGGPVSAGLSALGFLLGLVFNSERSREKDIEKRLKTIRDLAPRIDEQVIRAIQTAIAAFRDEIIAKARERGVYAVHDLNKVLRVDGQMLAPRQTVELKTLLEKLGTIGERLDRLHARVMRVTGLPVTAGSEGTKAPRYDGAEM